MKGKVARSKENCFLTRFIVANKINCLKEISKRTLAYRFAES